VLSKILIDATRVVILVNLRTSIVDHIASSDCRSAGRWKEGAGVKYGGPIEKALRDDIAGKGVAYELSRLNRIGPGGIRIVQLNRSLRN